MGLNDLFLRLGIIYLKNRYLIAGYKAIEIGKPGKTIRSDLDVGKLRKNIQIWKATDTGDEK